MSDMKKNQNAQEVTAAENSLTPIVEVAKFRDTLKDLTLDQLLELEQKLIKEADEHEKERNGLKLKMPEKGYAEAASAIRGVIGEMTIQWQYALVMKEMYEFFDPANRPEEIAFTMLDGVLRTVSNAQLKGYEQWAYVVTISDYFEPLREEYARVGSQVYIDAQKHDALINQMQLFKSADEAKAEVAEGLKVVAPEK